MQKKQRQRKKMLYVRDSQLFFILKSFWNSIGTIASIALSGLSPSEIRYHLTS